MVQVGALGLATLLSLHGLRKKSLSASGAGTAFVVGLLIMSGGVWVFGVALIGFYLVGSRATKYGKQRKATMEEGYHESGYRTGWQVLSNSAAGLVAAVVWNAAFVPGSLQSILALAGGLDIRGLLGVSEVYPGDGWCPLWADIGRGWSRRLMVAAIGQFGCCLGDTLASELGILAGTPRLITTWKKVPPGTNGAISLGGTIASAVGGLVVGVFAGAALLAENSGCRGDVGATLWTCIAWGVLAGVAGSMLDSFLGATVQGTSYSEKTGRVLADGPGLLTNNQVNAVSSVVLAGIAGWGCA